MSSFALGLDKEQGLRRKMLRLGVRQTDILERFVRSHGAGGQNVNKTSTCVHLRHIPTGLEVKCQKERSQALNRYLAWKILLDKIELAILQSRREEKEAIEKLRRQKRKRSKQAKLKILEEKRRRSQKKILRLKVEIGQGY